MLWGPGVQRNPFLPNATRLNLWAVQWRYSMMMMMMMMMMMTMMEMNRAGVTSIACQDTTRQVHANAVLAVFLICKQAL